MPKTIRSWQRDIHALSREKGWWPHDEERNIMEIICLCHCELSEAAEEYRKGKILDIYYNHEKPEGMFVELADTVIRILDFAEKCGVDLEHIMTLKHQYNKTREFRHGNKKA